MARASQSLTINKKVRVHKHGDGKKRPILVRKTGGKTITVSRNVNNVITISRQKINSKGQTTFHKVVRIKKGR